MSEAFRTMIVPASLAAIARDLGGVLSPEGVGMFTAGLSPSGSTPSTHFISTGYIEERFAICIASGEMLHAACVEAGAMVTRAQCDALVAQSDVSDEEPFVVFDRLGLRMVVE